MAFRQYTPEEWLVEIEDGLDYRRKFGIEGTWGELESIYYNVHPSMANDGPNVIMSTGDSILSSLGVPKPKIIVRPEQEEAVDKAPILESLDNVLFRELKLVEEGHTASLHAFLFGNGIAKIGYDSEYGFDPTLDVGGPLKMGFTLTQLSKRADRRIEHDSGVAPGMPWVKSVPPHDIIVPWGTLRLTNCPWIVHRFVRQIDDLKNDRKYKNTSRLVGNLSMEDFVGSYKSTIRLWRPNASLASKSSSQRYKTSERGNRDKQFIELYEIHDRRTGRIMVVAPNFDKFLRNDINALQIDNRLPFVSLSFTPKSRSYWTTSDAYYLRAAQLEISDLAVQRTKIRRLSVLKFLYDSDAISDPELAKILSPDVGAAAKIEGGQKLQEAIMPLMTHPDQGLILEEEHLRRNVREQIGFSRNQMGEFAGGRKTATEAQIVDGAAALRMSRRGSSLKDFYQDIISTINGILFKHWTTERAVQVLGENNAPIWEQVAGSDLKARYSYNVEFTDDSEIKREKMEALQLYSVLTQDPSVNPVALRQYLIDESRDPAFGRIFNADIQHAMRAMRLQGEVVQSQGNAGGGGRRGAAGVPQLQGANGQSGGSSFTSAVAGGRPSA